MKPSIRISIAYVVGSLISKSSANHIMAKEDNQFLKLSGNFAHSNIDVEEYESGHKYFGMVMDGQGTYVHDAENASIKFKLNGSSFTGTDSDSGKSFSGQVSGKTIKLYDYDEGKHFHYYLSE